MNAGSASNMRRRASEPSVSAAAAGSAARTASTGTESTSAGPSRTKKEGVVGVRPPTRFERPDEGAISGHQRPSAAVGGHQTQSATQSGT